jgi:hypothetical protein
MTRIRWRDLGDGERAAVVPDVDTCTARYVIDRPGEPTHLHRMTAPAETPKVAFRVVRSCPCCDRQVVITRYEDERVLIEEFTDDSS